MAEKLRGEALIEDAVKRGLMKADADGFYVAVDPNAPKPVKAKSAAPKLKVVGDLPTGKKGDA